MSDCIFCNEEVVSRKILENNLAFAIYDKYPATRGHVLVIPKRHSSNFFEMNPLEQVAMYALLGEVKKYLDEKYRPDGFNLLLNCGAAAGQVVFHTHLHVLPRYEGDGMSHPLPRKEHK